MGFAFSGSSAKTQGAGPDPKIATNDAAQRVPPSRAAVDYVSIRVIIYDTLTASEHGMPHFDFIWELTEDGNVAHIAEHGLTPDDVEPIVLNPERLGMSRSSGRPIAFGETPDGRYIAVVYERIDKDTVYPITAFEVED